MPRSQGWLRTGCGARLRACGRGEAGASVHMTSRKNSIQKCCKSAHMRRQVMRALPPRAWRGGETASVQPHAGRRADVAGYLQVLHVLIGAASGQATLAAVVQVLDQHAELRSPVTLRAYRQAILPLRK